ncbi:hypothetical protein MVEN_00593600 [Mycena venus]|uniref:DUF6699 domain-containing protein n=1 Tax=Mycena venus TaxID=2733690 RepID=A0A8H6YJU0_9AGAR|nr:hypothetical protein MVEN_00593600 [Mycena venus]
MDLCFYKRECFVALKSACPSSRITYPPCYWYHEIHDPYISAKNPQEIENMTIFSPRQKRSKCVPFTPSHVSPVSSFSSPSNLSWSFPHPLPPTFSPPSCGACSPLPSNDWGNSWHPQSPFSTPQNTLMTTSPQIQPWSLSMATYPSSSQYHPMPNWDISTPPATAFDHHALSAFLDLMATVPEHIQKIRIYVEKPTISYWTNQWGYATAYKRGETAITLLDVLEAIYNYFQEPLAVDVLPLQYQSLLVEAYNRRITRAGAAYNPGLARVDVLNGYRVLSGMRPLNYYDASGTMYIALCLGKVC